MIKTLGDIAASMGKQTIISGVFGREEDSKGRRFYRKPGTEEDFDSVTSVLSAVNSKSYLAAWEAKVAVTFTLANMGQLMAYKKEAQELLDSSGRDAVITWTLETFGIKLPNDAKTADIPDQIIIRWAMKQAKIICGLKAELGTYQHDVLEALVLDMPIPDIPEHLLGREVDEEIVDKSMLDTISDGLTTAYVDFGFQVLMSEATVANTMYGYAGTLDLIVFIKNLKMLSHFMPITPELRQKAEEQGGLYVLIDLKAGKDLNNDMKAQLAAYQRCNEVWINGIGLVQPMIKTDVAAVLHLRKEYPRGYKLIQMPTDDQEFDWFLQCQDILRKQNSGLDIRAGVLYPPLEDGSQPLPLIEDIYTDGFGVVRKKLVDEGIQTLDDLCRRSREDLIKIKGVGTKSADACEAMLAIFDMELRNEITQEEGRVA